jgi:hypothetical protein
MSFHFHTDYSGKSIIQIMLCEYEALVLGLEVARKLKIEDLIVYGDAELIVKKIKQQYQAKHLRLRSYRNCAWDLIEEFFSSFNIHHISRMENQQADSLAKADAKFVPPTVLKLKYHIEMRHMDHQSQIMCNIGRSLKMMSRLNNF